MYPMKHYKKQSKHILNKDGDNSFLCRSCVKKEKEKRGKRKEEERERPGCNVLQVGDRVVYIDCVMIEATVVKMDSRRSEFEKVRIACDRYFERQNPPKAIYVKQKYLRKIE
uniref:Uncharacterized protein n=1 Tax=Marseillevirus LCMAC101 TaxID=2506602 RepID=A0A481YU86_9VIRU|nr:MAG: hypothetical protein LCMAC101_06890 [Marseillevirus LCMAC101]